MRHSWLSWILLIIAILLEPCFAASSHAQSMPACRMDDLDITPQIADGPIYAYTLAVNFRNVSGHACSLNPSADEPSFFFQSAPSASLFTRCVSSKECAPSRASVEGPGVTLEPGAVGHQKYSWKTVPADPDGACVAPYGMDNTVNQSVAHFRIMSVSLFRQICSPVLAGPYEPGPFLPDRRAPASEAQQGPTIHIIPAESEYYEGERVLIRAVIADPSRTLSLEPNDCPLLLLRQYGGRGWVLFEEVERKRCKVEPSGAGVLAKVELEGRSFARGGNDLLLLAIAISRDRRLTIITSPRFRLNIADPATMERKWGPQVKGVAVSLALDRSKYDIGDDIPLHVAMENFAADDSIAGDLESPLVEIELRDACGQSIEPRGGRIWTSHGGCAGFLKGKIVPKELTLGDFGLRPDAPGTYTVTAIWRATSPIGCLDLQPYATVESVPVTFQVVDPEHTQTPKTTNCAGALNRRPN